MSAVEPADDLELVYQAARSEARRLRRRGVEVEPEELLGAAWLALPDARRRYRGECRWSGYAVQCMRYAIRRDLSAAAAKVPKSVREKQRRIERAEDRLAQRLGRWPSEMEVAAALGMDPEGVDRWRVLTRASDLYLRLLPDALPPPDHAVELAEEMAPVLRVLEGMPETYRTIVESKYLADETADQTMQQVRLKSKDVLRSLAPLILRKIRTQLAAA